MNESMSVDAQTRPGDLLTTRARLPPSNRPPDLPARLAAFCELSAVLADDPRQAIRQVLEIAMRLCEAGSAGFSLLRSDQTGQEIVRWETVGGSLASHEGIDTPRDGSPCGLCLDVGQTVLIGQPQQAFGYLRNTPPAIVQDLIVPLHDRAHKAIGTLWVVHHDAASRFSLDDACMLEQIAIQLVLALKLLEQSTETRYALALVESHQLAHRKLLAHDLANERRLRERAEASDSELRQLLAFKETAILEAHHRVKNTLQIAASLLSLHGRATASAEVRAALQESLGRLHLLAKVHEILSAGSDGTQKILMPTLLHGIGEALRESFSEMSGRVRLLITSEPIGLSPDDAIPIGLLVNEAVTNAYKHAFPQGASGMIAVNLVREPQNTIVLRIMDNGAGMDATVRNGSLGLKLIRNLAGQLRARFAFDKPTDSAGTVLTLRVQRATPRPGMNTAQRTLTT